MIFLLFNLVAIEINILVLSYLWSLTLLSFAFLLILELKINFFSKSLIIFLAFCQIYFLIMILSTNLLFFYEKLKSNIYNKSFIQRCFFLNFAHTFKQIKLYVEILCYYLILINVNLQLTFCITMLFLQLIICLRVKSGAKLCFYTSEIK